MVQPPAWWQSLKLLNLNPLYGWPSITTWRRNKRLNSYTTFPAVVNLTFDKLLLVQMVAELMLCVWFTTLLGIFNRRRRKEGGVQVDGTEVRERRWLIFWERRLYWAHQHLKVKPKLKLTVKSEEKNEPCLKLKQIFICTHVESVAASCRSSHPALCFSFSFFFTQLSLIHVDLCTYLVEDNFCMVLFFCLRYGVLSSPRWKPESGSSKAVDHWAITDCGAEVG